MRDGEWHEAAGALRLILTTEEVALTMRGISMPDPQSGEDNLLLSVTACAGLPGFELGLQISELVVPLPVPLLLPQGVGKLPGGRIKVPCQQRKAVSTQH